MLPRMTTAEAGTPLAEAGQPLAEPSPRLAGCPFLMSEAGGWRLDVPARDHRCAAFTPAAPLAPEKQSRLCLTDTHVTCATYLASIAAREARLGAAPVERATRWGLARTTTIIEDPGGIQARVLTALRDRRRRPAIPAVLLVVGLLALAISGFRGFLPATGAVATPSPSAAPVAVVPTPAPNPQPTLPAPTETPVPPSPTPALTLPPTGTPEPTKGPKPTFRTYTVHPGDTLSGIASRFHTTVSAIAQLNHISDPSKLRVGQVLLIPN
jgi:LysM repeat protein